MKNIFIVCAMKEELDNIDTKRFNETLLKNDMCVSGVLVTGVGKINVSSMLTYSIISGIHNKDLSYDLILNIGTSCGLFNCNIFDVVYGRQFDALDVDYCGGSYSFYNNFGNQDNFKHALMLSNDKFMTRDYYETIKDKLDCYASFDGAVLYDMETFALASIAKRFFEKFVSVRVVTDKPLVEDSYSMFEENLEPGMKLINGIINSDAFIGGLHEILAC